MLFPDWNIRLSKDCQEKWERRKETVLHEIHRSAWTPHPLWTTAAANEQLDALANFGHKIDQLIAEGQDPFWTLPKHRDPYFDNVFFYSKPPWCCYFYRRLLTRQAIGVLLVHQSDQPGDLRRELASAISRAGGEDDALHH